jgi:hypothetical protein
MVLRLLLAALVAVVALPVAWRLVQSAEFKAWMTPQAPAKPFKFDNGTVREPPASAAGSGTVVSHGLKKCRQGERVVYTDGQCPPGSVTVPIGGTVNVIDGGPRPARAPEVAGPADGAASPAGQGKRLPHVRDVLDYSRQPSLRDQHLERLGNR